ncbi:MAG: sigma-70 family RNA polymerase sigma factor [Planctomycetota bacterium]
MTSGFSSFCELIDAAKEGNDDAIEAIISEFSPLLNRKVMKFKPVQNGEISAQDCTQLTWMRVLTYLPKFKGADDDDHCRAAFTSWLNTTTTNVLINEQKRLNAKKLGKSKIKRDINTKLLEGNDQTPSAIVASMEMIDRLRNRLHQLDDPMLVEFLRLRFYENLKLTEIASRTDKSVDQVRHGIKKALNQLRIDWDQEE